MAIKITSCIVNNPQKTFILLTSKKFTPVPSTPGLAVANFLFYYKYSFPKPQLAVAVLDATPFVLGSCYICDIVLVISFVTFRHLINDMKMEICIFFTPNKNKRSCCGLTHTLFMAGSQSSSTYILVLDLYRQILVAYK